VIIVGIGIVCMDIYNKKMGDIGEAQKKIEILNTIDRLYTQSVSIMSMIEMLQKTYAQSGLQITYEKCALLNKVESYKLNKQQILEKLDRKEALEMGDLFNIAHHYVVTKYHQQVGLGISSSEILIYSKIGKEDENH
jgi:hypothetical protein